jgi:hypothetical protein
MAEKHSYVQTDEKGVIRVGGTTVSLDSVIAAWDRGDSPESIRSQFPALSLVEVYGAITWCLEHPEEVEAYRKRQDAVWEHWRAKAESDPPPVIKRLKEMREAQAKGA